MPVYRYKASNLDGKEVRGQMQAQNKPALREQLQAQSLYLSACSEAEEEKAARKLSAQQLADFCRELGTLIGAGVPMVRALNIMAKRDIPESIKDVYLRVYRAIKQGGMLSDAMEQQPTVFPELLRSMIRASEESGQMEQTCLEMAVHFEKTYKLQKKVRSAMTYPIILSIVTLLALLAIFLFVLPTFFQLFEDMDVALPGITQFMLNVSVGLKEHWLVILIIALTVVLIIRLVMQIPSVKLVKDRALLRVPVAGRLLKTIYTARFARTLSSCYASGISILSSLKNARDTVGNTYIVSQFAALMNDIRGGKSLSASIKKVDGFDSKLAASIQIGEETGKLYDMLRSLADSFDYESDLALSKLTALIEPVMIVIMAIVIGSVMISVMLPLTTLYDAIGMSGGL